MADAALQRKNMVESQIRPSDVTDRRITAAMSAVARETFVPSHLASLAYSDESLPISPGREILPPRVLAKLIQLAEIEESDTVLVISAAGYTAALIGEMASKVVALLPDADAVKTATSAFSTAGLANVTAVAGAAEAGWAATAPYDVVFVEGAIEHVPDSLKSQIRENGRLVAIVTNGAIGHAVEMHKRGGIFARRDAFQAAALPISGFAEARPAFVF